MIKFDNFASFNIHQMLMMLARFFISGPATAKLKTVDNARLFKQFDRAIYGCDGNCVIFFF